MPKTIEQLRIESAARVLAKHFPSSDRIVCLCGSEWHPQHQAEELSKAGCLGVGLPGSRGEAGAR